MGLDCATDLEEQIFMTKGTKYRNSKHQESHEAAPAEDYYLLNEEDTDPGRIKNEREKARKLRKTQWWLNQVNRGICHYCEKKFQPSELTLDHVVPLARGGVSKPGNVVPACKECNQNKKLHTPVDEILKGLKK
jgi:5-methylcytosine-specific restriction protein A